MLIEDRKEGRTLVLAVLEKRLDASVAASFTTKMNEYVDAGHPRIILNLAATEFIDSRGLGAIVTSFKRQGAHGSFALCEIRETTMAMFKLTRMDRVLSIHETEQQAIGASAAA